MRGFVVQQYQKMSQVPEDATRLIKELLAEMEQKDLYRTVIDQITGFHQSRMDSLKSVNPADVRAYLGLEKQSQEQSQSMESTSSDENTSKKWLKGQTVIFEWVFFCNGFSKPLLDKPDVRSTVSQQEKELNFLKQVFHTKHPMLIQYHVKIMTKLRGQGRSIWDEQETQLITSILNSEPQPFAWCNVALRLYEESEGKWLRSGVACREMWNNHLNPSINKESWSPCEDYKLFEGIKELGKKWSQIAKRFKESRTEHMVKNRYSILKKYLVRKNKSLKQEEILEILIRTAFEGIEKDKSSKTSTLMPPETDDAILHSQNASQPNNKEEDGSSLKADSLSQTQEIDQKTDFLDIQDLLSPGALHSHQIFASHSSHTPNVPRIVGGQAFDSERVMKPEFFF